MDIRNKNIHKTKSRIWLSYVRLDLMQGDGIRWNFGGDAAVKEPVLEMKHIYKHFSGITVLEDVSFSARSGEVHVLLGMKGA